MHPTAIAFELGDEIVVLSEASRDLFLLNPTAALVWRGFAAGLDVAEVADVLSLRTSRRREEIAKDCLELLGEWRRLGLIDGAAPAAAHAPPESAGARALAPAVTAESQHSRAQGSAAPAGQPADEASSILSAEYRLVDFAFVLRTGTRPVERAVHEHLAHLRVRDGSAAEASTLDLHASASGYRLECDGSLLDRCVDGEDLIPIVHGNLIMAAYRRSECMMALHAAAVATEEKCVLMVGVAGSGKSTLTSALLEAGLRYLSDDTVLLSKPPIRVRGVPSRICLKEGSWPVVGKRDPRVMSLPEHRRRDGKRVRYWLPERLHPEDIVRDALPARALVFVRYAPTVEGSLRRIGAGSALVRFAKAGYDVSDVLDRALVAALVDWIADIECFELEYDDERYAAERVKTLLAAGR